MQLLTQLSINLMVPKQRLILKHLEKPSYQFTLAGYHASKIKWRNEKARLLKFRAKQMSTLTNLFTPFLE